MGGRDERGRQVRGRGLTGGLRAEGRDKRGHQAERELRDVCMSVGLLLVRRLLGSMRAGSAACAVHS